MHTRRHLRPPIVFLVLASLSMGCTRHEEARRGPPPPTPSSKPAACAEGGGKVSDRMTTNFFPGLVAGFCLDANGGDKACGEGTPLPIDHICDLFDGECEVYRGYGIRHVVQVRYIDAGGRRPPSRSTCRNTAPPRAPLRCSPVGSWGMRSGR